MTEDVTNPLYAEYREALDRLKEAQTRVNELVPSAGPLEPGVPVPVLPPEAAAAYEALDEAQRDYDEKRDAYYKSR